MPKQDAGDSALALQTPEGIEFVLYPAGFLIRACAWVIDGLVQSALWIIILITVGITGRVVGIWLTLILIFVIDWFYHTIFEVFSRGQSPGKRFMGIRVVRGDGSPVNPGASFLRNLLRFADTFMYLYHIAFISMLVSKGFRRFGDMAADTLVVYTESVRSPGRFSSPAFRKAGMPWLADIKPVQPPRRLNYEEKQAILSFARRYPVLGKARSDEIAAIWTGKLAAEDTANSGTPEHGPYSDTCPSAMLLGIARALGG